MSASEVLKELGQLEALVKQHETRLLHPRFFALLNRKFQGKYDKVSDLLTGHCVLKYVFMPSGRIVWIVKGRERDYLIIPEAPYCHCTNFYMHIVSGKGKFCQHLAAQRIASVLDRFETIEERDELFESLTEEWKECQSSSTTE